ncbi:hypothetical protein [Achromobacter spanius]|uniref:hypothetical protein n=1 Tax=Achromobacter spanius TaxID=217203 RepID=UPI003209DA6C
MSHLIDTELPAGARTETRLIPGPAGPLELLIDRPATPRHKIPHRLAHSVRDAGWLAIRALTDQDAAPAAAILAGLPVGAVEGDRVYDTPPLPAGVVLIHGESDTQAPLQPLLAWARPTSHPIIVVPGADHFFNHSQDLLLSLVLAHLPKEAAKARTD